MKTAVVVFNLGGPDTAEAVRPFLFNLFNDRAIIGLPNPFRWLLAHLISKRREIVARGIYERLGGGSPILPNTVIQAQALEAALGPGHRVFVAMRYWHPRAVQQVAAVNAWGPDRVVLLPLYPQFSTTTSESSMREWQREAKRQSLKVESRAICCWPTESGFIKAVADRVREGLARVPDGLSPPRVLFTAHGLPKRVVDRGDPYAWQVESSVAAVVAALRMPDLDYRLCYQSRVGPLEWLGPPTEAEVSGAGAEGKPLVVVPIAFVSEHSETLVELDHEYREVAEHAGVPAYIRVGTVDALAPFVEALARLVRHAAPCGDAVTSGEGGRICPAIYGRCGFVAGGGA